MQLSIYSIYDQELSHIVDDSTIPLSSKCFVCLLLSNVQNITLEEAIETCTKKYKWYKYHYFFVCEIQLFPKLYNKYGLIQELTIFRELELFYAVLSWDKNQNTKIIINTSIDQNIINELLRQLKILIG